MKEPLISVIVLTYNQEDTIARTLDSVLAQCCSAPFEVVVGDDCSTDGTRHICEAYAKQHPDTIRLMPATANKGVVDNYYDCFETCRGEYIADCAGDDFWTDKYKLEKEWKVLAANANVTVVHTNWNRYYEDTKREVANKEVPFASPITRGSLMLESIITQTTAPVIHLCTAMYRAKVLRDFYNTNRALLRNKEFGCEDLQIAFVLAHQGDVAYLPETTLDYSVGHTSVSCLPDSAQQFRFVQRTASLSWLLASHFNLDTPRTRAFFALKSYELLMHAFRCHNTALRSEALEYANEWRVALGKKARCVMWVTKCPLMWRAALLLRKGLMGLKRVMHPLK